MAGWYYGKNRQQQGPVEQSELIRLLHAGEITSQTLVWREGLEQWRALEKVEELALQVPSEPPPLPELGSVAKTTAPLEKKAVASLSLAVLGLFFGGMFFGLPAVALGMHSRRKIAEDPGSWRGAGYAKAGIIIGVVVTLLHGGLLLYMVITGDFSLLDRMREDIEAAREAAQSGGDGGSSD